MFSKHYYLILIWFSIILIACTEDLKETSRLEKPGPFTDIILNDVFHVYLIEDTTFSVLISGYDDGPEKISLSVKNDSLTINNNTSSKWLNPETNKIKLYIRSRPLRLIMANATCSFETVNPITSNNFSLIMGAETKLMEGQLELNGNNFMYWNSHLCGGKLTLTGNVNYAQIYTFSTNSVDALNLVANQAWIENNSKGDCEIFVTNRLDYSIRGTGNIVLHGNPSEIILGERTSSGQLIRE